MVFWDARSAGAEAGLQRAYHRSGGPVAPGSQAFLGRGRLRIRRRRLGGKAVGGSGVGRFYRVCADYTESVRVFASGFLCRLSQCAGCFRCLLCY